MTHPPPIAEPVFDTGSEVLVIGVLGLAFVAAVVAWCIRLADGRSAVPDTPPVAGHAEYLDELRRQLGHELSAAIRDTEALPAGSVVAEQTPHAVELVAAAAARTDRELRDLGGRGLKIHHGGACARAGRLVGVAAIRVQNAARDAVHDPASPAAAAELGSALALLDDAVANLQAMARRMRPGRG